ALRLRLDDDLRQFEIAQRMGCSQMQVSRLLRRAAVRLRELTDPDLNGEQAPSAASACLNLP
ncbi:MAG: sigma factor-like helix-turn-helix DNA-binding protein, partial [Solirubrobacteraceae bacterium]